MTLRKIYPFLFLISIFSGTICQADETEQIIESIVFYEKLAQAHPENIDYLFFLGKLYDNENQSSEAIKFYKRALSLNPERQDILNKLAYRYLEDKNFVLSEKIFKENLAKNTQNVEPLIGLGLIEEQRKQFAKSALYLTEALKIDPENLQALLILAEIKIELDQLHEAKDLLDKVLRNHPSNSNAIKSLKYLEQKLALLTAQKLAKEKNFPEAIEICKKLVKGDPKNIDYLFALGKMYDGKNQSSEAIKFYKQALLLDPERQDILNKLAYRYFEDKNFTLSETFFNIVLDKNPQNVEALLGLGLIGLQLKEFDVAQSYFEIALTYESKNIKALLNLADVKIAKNADEQAYRLYLTVLAIEPHNKNAFKGLELLQKRLFLSDAKRFTEQGCYNHAIEIYNQMIEQFPEEIDAYLLLGKIYIRLNHYYQAIDVYSLALEKKPDNSEIKNALAFAFLRKGTYAPVLWDHYQWFIFYPYLFYFIKEDIYPRVNWKDLAVSENLFREILSQDPMNVDALVGMGRIETLKDNKQTALKLYNDALSQQPNHTTGLAYLAALYSSVGRYFSARDAYLNLLAIEPDDKTIQQDYIDVVNSSDPVYSLTGYYAEENEQDLISPVKKEWAARLKNFGGAFSWSFVVQDSFKIFGGLTKEYFVLKNLLNHTNIYSLDVEKGALGFSWKYNPYTSILAGAGFAAYSQFQKSNFFTKNGSYFQPFFNITYSRNHHKSVLETVADSPLVARNFTNNRSALIDRQFLRGLYEYDFGNRTLFGATAANIWYINPIKRNQQQITSAWIQVGIPKFWQYVVLRYQFIYGRFNKLTTDYYTYRFQTTHWINLALSKSWYHNKLITEAGCGHAWQRSFEQGQIIVVNPLTAFRLIHREINAAYARIQYEPNEFTKLAITSTYTLDTFNYTTAAITGKFSWRF